MSRLVVVLLILTLALAPTTGAQSRIDQQEESFSLSRWFQPLWGALDWLTSWLPTIHSTRQNVGAMIDPSGVAEPPPTASRGVPGGEGSESQKVGAMIDPSG